MQIQKKKILLSENKEIARNRNYTFFSKPWGKVLDLASN